MNIKIKDTMLGFLDNPNTVTFGLPEDVDNLNKFQQSEFGKSVRQAFSQNRDLFKDNIRYICEPFMAAYRKARPKLIELIFETDINESGTFIFKNKEFTNTIFYAVKTLRLKEDYSYEMILLQFSKHKDSEMANLDAVICESEHSRKTFFWKGFKDLV